MKGRWFWVSLKKNHSIRNFKKSLPESTINFLKYSFYLKTLHEEAPKAIYPKYAMKRKGSYTLEAAIIMPVLATFFALCLFFFRVIQLQLVVQNALETTARELSVYASQNREISEAEYFVLAKGMVMAKIEDTENVEQYVMGGALGISLIESGFSNQGVLLKATYKVDFPVNILGNRFFIIHQEAYRRMWTGWMPTEIDETDAVYVYVTETGTVYHKTSTCTHLDLSIKSVPRTTVDTLRNASGGTYKKCSSCAHKNNSGVNVYVTDYGLYYHSDLNCSGIKRTVSKVLLSEVEGKGACSRCWN